MDGGKSTYKLRKKAQKNFSRTLTHSHLSTRASFFCPQGGRCREVKLYMQSKNSPTPPRFTFLMHPAYAIVSPLKCSTTFISHSPPPSPQTEMAIKCSDNALRKTSKWYRWYNNIAYKLTFLMQSSKRPYYGGTVPHMDS